MRFLRGSRLLSLLLVLALWIGAFPARQVEAEPAWQTRSPEAKASALLATLTPEEKVGQLFLVTFSGRDTGPSSQIYDLIMRYHIGGVVLRRNNDNFTGAQDTVQAAYTLNTSLQTLEWQNSQAPLEAQPGTNGAVPAYIPLFIGIAQEGDGYPYDQILNGMSSLPSQMSIGATWEPALAAEVGNVAGRELSLLGINLFFGPSLDVLDLSTTGGDDLGSRTFGGDPYWVGRMGQEYIRGLHEGSLNRLVVIAKHFPGRGGSDRAPETEVATVRKSLEQLKQIELAPFFAVTGNSPSQAMTADGLLVSHIRYQGFQGNIRATTRPVSLDQSALELIMGLTEFSTWRADGGIVVSDDLGSQAVRRFYDPTGTSFDPRQVARTALQAGNDLLYADNLAAPGDPDSYTALVRTLAYFAQKYREDTAFAQRVDASVMRLLTVKYRLYPEFDLQQVLPAQDGLAQVGGSSQAAFDVASKADSLISPSRAELVTVLPDPPGLTDRVVFLTDAVTYQQCSRCGEQQTMAVDALQNAVLRLYGPRAGGEVQGNYLTSYSFDTLIYLLDGDQERAGTVEQDLRLAKWVVVSMTDVRNSRGSSLALRRLMAERPELLSNKKVVVFAMAAPYYLDATELSMVSAYYGLYSKSAAFIDLAARLLFQEEIAQGASPVSVPGVGYDLISATSPNPDQEIGLFLDLQPQEGTPTPQPTATGETPQAPFFQVGDVIPLRTGVIVDHNGHPVPDGTVVRFLFNLGGESGTVQQIEATTMQGVARTSYRIAQPGTLEIRVMSDPATRSTVLRLENTSGEPAQVVTLTPTPQPTNTPTATPTPTLEPTPMPTPMPTPVLPTRTNFGDWILGLLAAACASLGVFFSARRLVSLRWSLRWGLAAGAGALLAYFYLAMGLPGSSGLLENAAGWGVILASLLGAALGGLGGWLWYYLDHPGRIALKK